MLKQALKIKIGIAILGTNYPRWIHKMLTQIMVAPYTSIDIVLVLDNPPRINKSYSVFQQVVKAEYLFFPPGESEFRDLSTLISKFHQVTCNFRDVHLAFNSLPVDLIINLSGYKIDSAAATIPACGIWSYYNGSVENLLPNIITDVFHNRDEVASYVSIMRSQTKDAVLIPRYFSRENDFSAVRNIDKYYRQTISFIPDLLRQLAIVGEHTFFADINKDKTSISSPTGASNSSLLDQMGTIVSYYLNGVKNKITKQFFFEQWYLRFSLHSNGIFPDKTTFQDIIPGKHLDWADPHVVYRGGFYYIFIEELLHKRKKGHISVIKMNDKGEYDSPRVIIERPYHLSYPFIFKVNDVYYMVPESAENRTIELYKCEEFPYKWKFDSLIMSDIYAVDSTFLFYKGKWWLFANVKENQDSSSLSFLHIYHSNSIFSGEWIPHLQNPVVSDAASSRPAGRFLFLDGNLYRPSQNCLKKYGYGIKLNKVLLLNEREYREEPINFIEPEKSKNILATHTFSFSHKLTMIDARKKRRR